MKRFVQNKLNNKIEPMFSRQGVFIDQLFRAILARIKNIFQDPKNRSSKPKPLCQIGSFDFLMTFRSYLTFIMRSGTERSLHFRK